MQGYLWARGTVRLPFSCKFCGCSKYWESLLQLFPEILTKLRCGEALHSLALVTIITVSRGRQEVHPCQTKWSVDFSWPDSKSKVGTEVDEHDEHDEHEQTSYGFPIAYGHIVLLLSPIVSFHHLGGPHGMPLHQSRIWVQLLGALRSILEGARACPSFSISICLETLLIFNLFSLIFPETGPSSPLAQRNVSHHLLNLKLALENWKKTWDEIF